MSGAIVLVFVIVVTAVIVSIACPKSRNTFSVSANKLVAVTSAIGATWINGGAGADGSLVDALLPVVDLRETVGALADGTTVRAGVAGVGASAVVELANGERTILTFGSVDLDSSWGVVQPLYNLLHVGSSVKQ